MFIFKFHPLLLRFANWATLDWELEEVHRDVADAHRKLGIMEEKGRRRHSRLAHRLRVQMMPWRVAGPRRAQSGAG